MLDMDDAEKEDPLTPWTWQHPLAPNEHGTAHSEQALHGADLSHSQRDPRAATEVMMAP